MIALSLAASGALALGLGARYHWRATVMALGAGVLGGLVADVVGFDALPVVTALVGSVGGYVAYDGGGPSILEGRRYLHLLRVAGALGVLVALGSVAAMRPVVARTLTDAPLASLLFAGILVLPGVLGAATFVLD